MVSKNLLLVAVSRGVNLPWKVLGQVSHHRKYPIHFWQEIRGNKVENFKPLHCLDSSLDERQSLGVRQVFGHKALNTTVLDKCVICRVSPKKMSIRMSNVFISQEISVLPVGVGDKDYAAVRTNRHQKLDCVHLVFGREEVKSGCRENTSSDCENCVIYSHFSVCIPLSRVEWNFRLYFNHSFSRALSFHVASLANRGCQ